MPQEILMPKPAAVIPEFRCERCRFADLRADKSYDCHRHPPTTQAFPTPGPGGQQGFMIHTCWPIVLGTGWCGEFKIRPRLRN